MYSSAMTLHRRGVVQCMDITADGSASRRGSRRSPAAVQSKSNMTGEETMTMRTACLTIFAMLAFAANSLLCRLALKDGHIDAASFTGLRIGWGALLLALIIRARGARPLAAGNWRSAWALFVYAAGFSYAYLGLSAATGALLLFGAVQATMLAYGFHAGERMARPQVAGLAIAAAGLIVLLLPGLAAPSLPHALLMAAAGIGWGVYSLRARGAGDPANATAGNFLRSADGAGARAVLAALVAHRWRRHRLCARFGCAGLWPGLCALVPGIARA